MPRNDDWVYSPTAVAFARLAASWRLLRRALWSAVSPVLTMVVERLVKMLD